jgi:hypothetical protein
LDVFLTEHVPAAKLSDRRQHFAKEDVMTKPIAHAALSRAGTSSL